MNPSDLLNNLLFDYTIRTVALGAAVLGIVAGALGTFALLIPGLAEVLAPDVFANNPNARYGLLAGLIGVAIANLNGLDLNALAGTLGLPPLNPDFGR